MSRELHRPQPSLRPSKFPGKACRLLGRWACAQSHSFSSDIFLPDGCSRILEVLGPPGSCNLSPENFDPPIFPSLYPPDEQDLAPRGKEKPGAETLGALKRSSLACLCVFEVLHPHWLQGWLWGIQVSHLPPGQLAAGMDTFHHLPIYQVNELLAHKFLCRVIPMAFHDNPGSQYITNVLCKHNKGVDPTH